MKNPHRHRPAPAVQHPTEIELKFIVPPAARATLMREMTRGTAAPRRSVLAARYLDTPDRRLAREGLSWRLRRENGRWIQTLKSAGSHLLERFEHEVMRPDSSPDATAHQGTPAGDRLLSLLRRAQADGLEPVVRFQTDVRRSVRRLRLRGAVVEVAYDEGRLLAVGTSQRIREVEFELKSGSIDAMLALAERWRQRWGLVYEPRSKSERGDSLASGSPQPAVRKAALPTYVRDAGPAEALGAVLDECLAQITRNALGLSQGDPVLRVEHVHQLRVGIRRLRSALRSFEGWVGAPPTGLVDDLRRLFAALGQARDLDVLDSGVGAELALAGAPPLKPQPAASGPEVSAATQAPDTQKVSLAWIAWRIALTRQPALAQALQPAQAPSGAGDGTGTRDGAQDSDATRPVQPVGLKPGALPRQAQKRLRKWHTRIARDLADFENLDEHALHALRKRVKRQRYAVEFFSPLLRPRRVKAYLRVLADLQDEMGALNDLFVARTRYEALVATDPAAWFALGWLAARIAERRTEVKPALAKLVRTEPPQA